MKKLHSLVINCAPLTKPQMDSICQIDTLEELRLYGLKSVANGDVLQSLPKLKNLKELWLYNIDDSAVPYICGANNLERLSLSAPRLTVGGLSELTDRLTKLKYLDARASRASDRDLRRLQDRPGLHVRTDR